MKRDDFKSVYEWESLSPKVFPNSVLNKNTVDSNDLIILPRMI